MSDVERMGSGKPGPDEREDELSARVRRLERAILRPDPVREDGVEERLGDAPPPPRSR